MFWDVMGVVWVVRDSLWNVSSAQWGRRKVLAESWAHRTLEATSIDMVYAPPLLAAQIYNVHNTHWVPRVRTQSCPGKPPVIHNNLGTICAVRFCVNIPQMACLQPILLRLRTWNDHVKLSFPIVTEQCYVTPAFSGIPNAKRGGQNQKWSPTKGNKIRSGCLTIAFLGAQKRVEMLRHPCILGGPQTGVQKGPSPGQWKKTPQSGG